MILVLRLNRKPDFSTSSKFNSNSSRGLRGFKTIPFPLRHDTHARGINNRGQIVGYIKAYVGSGHEFHGFVYDRGVFRIIDYPFTGQGTLIHGINDHGQMVGQFYDSNGGSRGLLFEPNGAIRVFDATFPGASNTNLDGINNRGEVAGSYSDSNGLSQAFILDIAGNGVFNGINFPPRTITNASTVIGINDRGQIVGCHDFRAFILQAGVFTFLNIPFTYSCGNAINNIGSIVGLYLAATGAQNSFVATRVPQQRSH